ncbi:hypothetical protein KGF57_001949 [Candida theae]|uniref:Uncharacterized protein n=1 Tax=Candida theae TaxID=1198502 RepID=A0AAD5BG41_9ASCO|nr:uncharacterized protein KGF57_001949 [Candida theae]KAI5960278.1 hypothetical protein KGF57_001949 [Candida theae]
MPILQSIYANLSQPSKISIPSSVKSSDLMVFRKVLTSIRSVTQSVNKDEKLRGYTRGGIIVDATTMGDSAHDRELIKHLTELKRSLAFKKAGDP